MIRKSFSILGNTIGWFWTIVAGIGGLGLIITRGPWPPTNGWFALISGISACPSLVNFIERRKGIRIPIWIRIAVPILIIIIGRLTLTLEGVGTFFPDTRGPLF